MKFQREQNNRISKEKEWEKRNVILSFLFDIMACISSGVKPQSVIFRYSTLPYQLKHTPQSKRSRRELETVKTSNRALNVFSTITTLGFPSFESFWMTILILFQGNWAEKAGRYKWASSAHYIETEVITSTENRFKTKINSFSCNENKSIASSEKSMFIDMFTKTQYRWSQLHQFCPNSSKLILISIYV
jgi:hypothetical protein